nr:hypothetical protein [uncultured Roseococcus sp.]
MRSAGREALPFVVRVEGPDGSLRSFEARAVIDASGTWATKASTARHWPRCEP